MNIYFALQSSWRSPRSPRPVSPKKPLHLTSSTQWVDYFTSNAQRQREIPWNLPVHLSGSELSEIIPSLKGWQLGETSDGSHLLAAARDYATRMADPDFIEAVRLFIAEEQRHGNNLGRFLDLAGVKRARWDWGDTLFRLVRYFLPHMEVWATPVLMVETHALVYYNAIRFATSSIILQKICEQILADEVAHIRFQCERLAILHRNQHCIMRWVRIVAHRLMFSAITLAVWVGHGRALTAGGYRFKRFWRSAWRKMKYAWALADPRAYSLNDRLRPGFRQ